MTRAFVFLCHQTTILMSRRMFYKKKHLFFCIQPIVARNGVVNPNNHGKIPGNKASYQSIDKWPNHEKSRKKQRKKRGNVTQ